MRTYIIRRLLLVIPTLFIVSIIIFFLIRLIPGDIIDARVAQLKQTGAVIEDVEAFRATLEREMGLDVSILAQYGRWIELFPKRMAVSVVFFKATLGLPSGHVSPYLRR